MKTRWRGAAAVLTASTLLAASLGLTVVTVPAGAALGGLTEFAIDGDADGPNDWQEPYAALRDLTTADDVCDVNPVVDDGGEEITDEPSRIPQGTKLDEVNLDDPTVEAGNVNRKSDLCRVYQAWEIVKTSTLLGTDQYQIVFYGAWTRPNVNGEINVMYPLLGPEPGPADDIIVNYDFKDSTDETLIDVLTWDGSTWVSNSVPAAYVDATTGRDVSVDGIDDPVTFGEVAVNLTLGGFLPEEGPCEIFTSSSVLSRTGNSDSASMMDYAGFASPVEITKCGAIELVKHTQPTPASPQQFDFSVTQADGAPVELGSTAIGASLTVPPNPASMLLDGLLISPDYLVEETSLPALWEQQSLVCTAEDPLTGLTDTYTLYPGEAEPFPVGPWMTAVCEVVNIGPPTLTLQKVTVTGAGGPFTITATPSDPEALGFTEQLTTTDPETPIAGTTRQLAPGAYTVEETGYPDTFTPLGYLCEVLSPGDEAPALIESEDPVTLDLAQGDEAVCIVANRLLESDLFVVKDPDVKVDPGAVVTFTMLVGNNGPDAAKQAIVRDTFPAGLTPTAIVDDGPYTCGLAGQVLTCTIPEHPVGVDATITVTAKVDPDAEAAATYVNTAVVENLVPPDVDETNNEDSATVTVTSADLVVQKTPDGGTYAPGAVVEWTITVKNKGPDAATSATLTDTFPDSLTDITVVDDGPYTCTVDGQKLSCTIASHPVGVTAVISVTGKIEAKTVTGTKIENTATVSSVTPDLVPADNTDTGYVDVLILPKTGADTAPLLAAALGLVAVGSGLVTVSRLGRAAEPDVG
jgi:uncharacterized repeat protein (TIGR01451 family)